MHVQQDALDLFDSTQKGFRFLKVDALPAFHRATEHEDWERTRLKRLFPPSPLGRK